MISCPPAYVRFVALFCLVWPFLALAFLRRRERSSAPLAAMLLPFAIASCGTWLRLADTWRGMVISGAGPLSMSLGISDALATLVTGGLSAGAVAVAALIRRHRPVADRGVLVLTVLAVANAVAAIVFMPAIPEVWIGAWSALAIAMAALVWLIAVARTIVAPRPLPHYALVVFAYIVGVAILAWQHGQ